MSFIFEGDWQRYLPWFWLALVVLCSVVEALSMTLTTVWFAVAAFLMVFVAMLSVPFPFQLLLFAIVSALLLIFTRPVALRFLKKKTPTNSDSLIGRQCKLIRAVTRDEKGSIRLNGIEWAVATADGRSIDAGMDCVIQEIQGNTLIVSGV